MGQIGNPAANAERIHKQWKCFDTYSGLNLYPGLNLATLATNDTDDLGADTVGVVKNGSGSEDLDLHVAGCQCPEVRRCKEQARSE